MQILFGNENTQSAVKYNYKSLLNVVASSSPYFHYQAGCMFIRTRICIFPRINWHEASSFTAIVAKNWNQKDFFAVFGLFH